MPANYIGPGNAPQKRGVSSTHPEYDAMSRRWQRCRDVSAGQDAMQAAGEAYIPRLAGQTNEDYQAMLCRGIFYNATWRTIAGLVGMLYRKPPTIETPAGLDELLADVNSNGMPLQIFTQKGATDTFEVGRWGILVDYPTVAVDQINQADAARMKLRPTMQMYTAESIINWKMSTLQNQRVLSMVVLTEQREVPVDEFTSNSKTVYRVLDLDPARNYQYRVRVFEVQQQNSAPLDVLIEGPFYPLMNGKPLTEIPFVLIGADDISPDVDVPPLIDLVDMNVSHYKTTIDYEHGCHFAGLPTPVISGYEKQPNDTFPIGSPIAWIFPDPQAKATFLEFTGQGLQPLEKNLESKEQRMAILGARMLEQQKRAQESADLAEIHRKGEESILSNIAQTISLGVTRALQWFSDWAGKTGKVLFELNREFYPTPVDPQMLTALVAAWQDGAFSYDTLWARLQVAEIAPMDVTAEEERGKIKDEPPMLLAPPGLPKPAPNAPAAVPSAPATA